MVSAPVYKEDRNKMKTVTVIIPTFNRWPDICLAVDSVLEQSYQKIKCVVVDDASTDSTVVSLQEKYGNDITVIKNDENRGQSFCRNLGVESCDSDYVCFLDSDDILWPESVTDRVSLFYECDEDIYASFGVFRTSGMGENDLLHKKKRGERLLLPEYLEQISWCNNNGFLIDRKTFLADGMYEVRLRNKEDVDLLIRLLSKYSFYYCGTEIGEVRDVCGSDRARYDHEGIIEYKTLFSDIVQGNGSLDGVLDGLAMHRLICSDTEEVLRSLYKLGRYRDYRLAYKQAKNAGKISNTKRFFQRYMLSYVKGLLSKK